MSGKKILEQKTHMENELIINIDKLHTTELGIVRIKRNISLPDNDVVSWCKEQIQKPETVIAKQGKNWYIETTLCKITVNAHSYTIITAHKIKTISNSKTCKTPSARNTPLIHKVFQ